MNTDRSIHHELLNEYSSLDQYSAKAAKLGDILNSYIENDRIHNGTLVPENFIRALVEVLKRMPDDDYYEIPEELKFLVETKHMNAQNIKLNACKVVKGIPLFENYYIVAIFCTALGFPHNALVGLIAHEIAHSFGEKPDYKSDEDATDALVARWGFQAELQALQKHKKDTDNPAIPSK